jgi:hypothetical protein
MYFSKTRLLFTTLAILSLALTTNLKSMAGPNDFFGGNIPQQDGQPGAMQPSAGATAGTDFTDDEKRMRRKYKANMASARQLIAKGEGMMKSKQKDQSHKDYKKGKILKEIGERRLAELKANSPFPEVAERTGSSTQ